jgi:hypothetical protein
VRKVQEACHDKILKCSEGDRDDERASDAVRAVSRGGDVPHTRTRTTSVRATPCAPFVRDDALRAPRDEDRRGRRRRAVRARISGPGPLRGRRRRGSPCQTASRMVRGSVPTKPSQANPSLAVPAFLLCLRAFRLPQDPLSLLAMPSRLSCGAYGICSLHSLGGRV